MTTIWSILGLYLMLNVVLGEEYKEPVSANRVKRASKPKAKIEPSACKKGKYANSSVVVSVSQKDGNCVFDFIGDKGCDMQLTCDIDLPGKPDSCDDEVLKISDGFGGLKSFCGKQKLVNIQPHAPEHRDLFVDATGAGGKPWSCKSSCSSAEGTRLEKGAKKKEEHRCVCGLQNKDDRIVGGEDAKMNEFPWQAAIVFPGTRSPICGGSLINERFILTAAHCFWFDNMKPNEIEVLLHANVLDMTKQADAKDVALGQKGSIRGSGYNAKAVKDADEKTQRFRVAEIINHPLFNEHYDYDYAVLRLEDKIDLAAADAPTPVCLPDLIPNYREQTYEKTKPWVVGWGKSHESAGASTRVLQKLEVPVIPLKKCDSWVEYVTQRMVCAGYEEGGKDACTGDSGGPLILKRPNKQWEQIGIVSWGSGCARAKSPGFYSRVTENLAWIVQHSSTHSAKWCKATKD